MKFRLSEDFVNPPEEAQWNQYRMYMMSQLELTNITQVLDSNKLFSEEEIKDFTEYREFLMTAEKVFNKVLDIEFPAYATYYNYRLVLIKEPYRASNVSKSAEESFWDRVRAVDPDNELLKQRTTSQKTQ